MERKEEIIELLKSLLHKSYNVIDRNQYSNVESQILDSSEKLVSISKKIELYLEELKKLA